MTEYEAISLFNDFFGNLIQILFGYVSVLSAFLVMTFFASHKISKFLVALVLFLFTFVCLMLILQFNFVKIDIRNLYLHILELQAQSGSSSNWFGTVPTWAISIQTWAQNIVTIGGYFGCILFFFYKRNRQTEEGDT